MNKWPGPEGSLRDLIKALAADLNAIRLLLETMSEKPVKPYEFEQIKSQVAGLAEALRELEVRVIALEQHKSTASWVFRQIITVGMGLLLAYMIGVLR